MNTYPFFIRTGKAGILFIFLLGIAACVPNTNRNAKYQTWSSSDTAKINHEINRSLVFLYDKPDSARYYLRKAERESRAIGYYEGIGFALQYRGSLEASSGNYDKATTLYNEALAICKKIKYISKLPYSIYINMGTSYVYTGDYNKASNYYYKALQYITRYIPNDPDLSIIYINLAAVQTRLEQYQKALFYADNAEKMARQGKQLLELAGALNNKGDIYIALHKTAEAGRVLKEAYKIAASRDFVLLQQSVLCSQGELALQLQQNREAIAHFKKAMTLGSSTSPFYSSIVPQYKLGIAYYRLKEYGKAEQTLLAALQKADKTDLRENSSSAYKTLSAVYAATGRYKKALQAEQAYIQLKDSATNKEKANAINELEIKYNSAQKDNALAQKQLQISQQQNRITQKNIWIGSISLGAILLTVLLIVRSRVNKQKQEGQAKEIQILKQEQEIDHLKAMMQGAEEERIRIARALHDGVVSQLLAVKLHFAGTLQNKQGSILRQQDFQDTLHYLDDATKELRITAHNLMPDTVLQNGLVAALHTYCNKMSAVSSIPVDFQYIGLVNPMDPDVALTLYRIVQELIQNAQKHAKASHILVQLNGQDHLLSITVEDNGIGYNRQDVAGSGAGMGLKSIDTRVKSLNGQIEIESTKGVGTTIYMEFTLNDRGQIDH